MRRAHRLAALLLLTAALPVLAGCEDFDPDKLDIFHLSEKKKLPGERKEVFPGGVPGVTQGVPAEYMKGYKAPDDTANADATLPPASKVNPGDEDASAALKSDTASPTPAEKPKPKPKRKAKVKPKPAPQPAQVNIQASPPGQQPPWPANTPQPQAAQSPWPATNQQTQSPSAPAQNEASSPWPAPPAPGTFGKQ